MKYVNKNLKVILKDFFFKYLYDSEIKYVVVIIFFIGLG